MQLAFFLQCRVGLVLRGDVARDDQKPVRLALGTEDRHDVIVPDPFLAVLPRRRSGRLAAAALTRRLERHQRRCLFLPAPLPHPGATRLRAAAVDSHNRAVERQHRHAIAARAEGQLEQIMVADARRRCGDHHVSSVAAPSIQLGSFRPQASWWR